MAIVDMSHFRLTLFAKDKERLLESLQAFDAVHMQQWQEAEDFDGRVQPGDTARALGQVGEDMNRAEEALKLLQPYEEKANGLHDKFSNALPALSVQEARSLVKEADAQSLMDQVFEKDAAIRRNKETIGRLQEEIKALRHWQALDLPLETMKKLKKVEVQLGSLPSKWMEEARHYLAREAQGTYMEFLSSDEKNAYVLLIHDGRDAHLDEFLRDVAFTPVHLEGEGTIAQLIAAKERAIGEEKKNWAQTEVQLKQLARMGKRPIEVLYEQAALRKERLTAESHFLESEKISFVTGFIPTARQEEFRKLLDQVLPEERYALELEEAKRADPEVPILLENNAIIAPFESLVETYSMPLYKEKDPTGLLAPWYMLFFGLMMGDLGYGLVMLLATTLALRFFDFKPTTRKSLRFFQILSIPTILAGAAFGSIFGGLIPMKPLILDPTQQIMPMILFSVVLGVVNIFFALFLGAFQSLREKTPSGALFDHLSWVFLIGGLLVGGLAKGLKGPAMVATTGFLFAIIGGLLIIFFSARDEKSKGARVAWGLYNLYGATSYIGDFASFTRVTALMLSGAYIGFSFNLIGKMIMGISGADAGIWTMLAQGKINLLLFLLAMVLLVFLHLFNLFLSGLSAYVHSMRLIYVEYFGKFYQGGGKPFKKLRPEGKYIDLK